LVFGHREGIAPLAGYLSYFGLSMFAVRWWRMADRHRSQRLSVAPLFAVAFWAVAFLVVWPWPKPPVGVLPLLLSAGIVQLVSPWQPPAPATAKRVRLRYA
jgi:hypothetical protein